MGCLAEMRRCYDERRAQAAQRANDRRLYFACSNYGCMLHFFMELADV